MHLEILLDLMFLVLAPDPLIATQRLQTFSFSLYSSVLPAHCIYLMRLRKYETLVSKKKKKKNENENENEKKGKRKPKLLLTNKEE